MRVFHDLPSNRALLLQNDISGSGEDGDVGRASSCNGAPAAPIPRETSLGASTSRRASLVEESFRSSSLGALTIASEDATFSRCAKEVVLIRSRHLTGRPGDRWPGGC